MRLSEWVSTLRTAARPFELAPLSRHLNNITNRASALCKDSSFFITQTSQGVKIVASNPSERARRALDRAVSEEMPAIQQALAEEARGRLIR